MADDDSLKRKYGLVILLDALGASTYSDDRIKKFLKTRATLTKSLIRQANEIQSIEAEVAESDFTTMNEPNTYTFGDTLMVVLELSNKERYMGHLILSIMLMRNYLYHSLCEGILYRGAFSIGSYIEEPKSNTVMGEAVSDAASWYEQSDWMGLHSTPKTNNTLEFHFGDRKILIPELGFFYPVPMKDGPDLELYTISWAGRFFGDDNKLPDPKKKFLELLKDLPIPFGTELKFENTKKYFDFVEESIAAAK
ncbi:MAG: hypothetical protein KOO62_12260 [candidate division Zixibacteria bacterium]|nr:hypothetical protein [candidate division Zixibacteria bacterium]